MPTTTIHASATYEQGILRPRRRLPLREHAKVTLILQFPTNPVRETRRLIRLHPRTARAIIYGDESDFLGS